MIDQYIYSRNDGNKPSMASHIGHDLMYYTEGIIPIKQGVSEISYYVNENKDAAGTLYDILSKRAVTKCEGKTSLYLSKFIIPEKQRGFLYCHGYVFDDASPEAVNPDLWFNQEFYHDNPNEADINLTQMDTFSGIPTELWPLDEVLEKTGYSLEEFTMMVKNCIDAKNNKSTVIVSLDFDAEDVNEVRAQLIRWIYHFLPFSMRRQAGFTTCYDGKCLGGDFSLVFIPSSIITERGKKPFVSARIKPNNTCYLYALGQITHISSPRMVEMSNSGLLYSKWLGRIISNVYAQPYDVALDTLTKLDGIYQYFDELTRVLPLDKQIQEKYLNAACWVYLNSNDFSGARITEVDDLKTDTDHEAEHIETMLDFSNSEILLKNVDLIFEKALVACKQDESEFWVGILGKMVKMGIDVDQAQEILAVFLAHKIDVSDGQTVEQCYAKFHAQCAPYLDEKNQCDNLEKCFFTDMIRYESFWESAQVKHGEEDGDARSQRMLAEMFASPDTFKGYIQILEKTFDLISKFQVDHKELICGWVDDAFRNVSISGFTVVPLNLLLTCQSKKRLHTVYAQDTVITDFVSRMYPHIEKEVYDLCLSGLERQNLTDVSKYWIEGYELIKEEPDCVHWWKEAFGAIIQKGSSLSDLESMDAAFVIDEDGFDWGCELIQIAQKLQIPEEDCKSFLKNYVLWYNNKSRSKSNYITWLKTLDAKLPIKLEKIDLRDIKIVSLILVKKFICNEDYSYAGLLHAIRGCESALSGITSYLYKLFDQDIFNDLGIDIIDKKISIDDQMREKPKERAEAYLKVLKKKDCDDLIRLLDMYPSAPEGSPEGGDHDEGSAKQKLMGLVSKRLPLRRGESEDGVVYEGRDGKYEWMITDDYLLRTLTYMVSDEQFLKDCIQKNELYVVQLIEAIHALCPEKSVLVAKGNVLKQTIVDICKKRNLTSANAQKALKALKKRDIL